MVVNLTEMARIGRIDNYDVYYATENVSKFDHVHLKLKGTDIVEFWLTKSKFTMKKVIGDISTREANKLLKKINSDKDLYRES